MIDWIVLGFILLSAVFGLIRGIISQVMAIVGIIAAYFAAPLMGKAIGGIMQEELGCTRFMADKASIFLVGLAVYLTFRLVGYGVEKLMVNRVGEFKRMNRLGGALLGSAKAMALIAIFFCFVTLLPSQVVQEWTPKLGKSHTYRIAARYNPMGNQAMLDRMRQFRTTLADPQRNVKLKADPQMKELLQQYDLDNALNDQRFTKSMKEGDFDAVRRHEKVEELMKDDKLQDLLAKLDGNSTG